MSEGKIPSDEQGPEVENFIFYIDAFRELLTCKTEETASVPFTSIVEYFKIYGGSTSFEEFHFVIREMDSTYCLQMNDKNKKSKGDSNGSKRTTKNSKSKV